MFEVIEKYTSYAWLKYQVNFIELGDGRSDQVSWAHMAAKAGYYGLLIDLFIEKYEFDPDLYKPLAKLTLLHTIAKNRPYVYNEWEKV